MRTTRSLDEFLAGPTGCCFLGGVFAYWSRDPDLWGLTVRGHVTQADVQRLIDVLKAEYRLRLPSYASLVDMRGLASVDADAFAAWAAFLDQHRREQRDHVQREAVVRPSGGLIASVLAGYLEVMTPLHPTIVTDSLSEALAWLGRPDALPIAEDMEALASGDPLDALRATLAPPFPFDTLDAAATHLGMSRRTLQRHLAAAGTTFQAELAAARVRAAQGLLMRTDHKLSAIAREVGFATQSHFTHVFRRVTGERPAEWRARHRDRS
jgi:AraC-like DNA-binding protein